MKYNEIPELATMKTGADCFRRGSWWWEWSPVKWGKLGVWEVCWRLTEVMLPARTTDAAAFKNVRQQLPVPGPGPWCCQPRLHRGPRPVLAVAGPSVQLLRGRPWCHVGEKLRQRAGEHTTKTTVVTVSVVSHSLSSSSSCQEYRVEIPPGINRFFFKLLLLVR